MTDLDDHTSSCHNSPGLKRSTSRRIHEISCGKDSYSRPAQISQVLYQIPGSRTTNAVMMSFVSPATMMCNRRYDRGSRDGYLPLPPLRRSCKSSKRRFLRKNLATDWKKGRLRGTRPRQRAFNNGNDRRKWERPAPRWMWCDLIWRRVSAFCRVCTRNARKMCADCDTKL